MADGVPIENTRRRLYLIRHGDVRYFDAKGKPLDPRSVTLSVAGEAQVDALRKLLSGVSVDRALSSDYPRARQTLERVLSAPPRSGKLESVAVLREVRAGRLREISPQNYEREVVGAYRRAAEAGAAFLRGEPWDDFSDRVTGWFQGFLAENDWRDALIASHDAVNRILLAWLVSGDRSAIPLLEQDPACLNIVDLDCNEAGAVEAAYLRLLNFTPYNALKTGERTTVMERIAKSMRCM